VLLGAVSEVREVEMQEGEERVDAFGLNEAAHEAVEDLGAEAATEEAEVLRE
jgi:hypothetical protein